MPSDTKVPATLLIPCDRCGKRLTQPGGLLFSPPSTDDTCRKLHVCVGCWDGPVMLGVFWEKGEMADTEESDWTVTAAAEFFPDTDWDVSGNEVPNMRRKFAEVAARHHAESEETKALEAIVKAWDRIQQAQRSMAPYDWDETCDMLYRDMDAARTRLAQIRGEG